MFHITLHGLSSPPNHVAPESFISAVAMLYPWECLNLTYLRLSDKNLYICK